MIVECTLQWARNVFHFLYYDYHYYMLYKTERERERWSLFSIHTLHPFSSWWFSLHFLMHVPSDARTTMESYQTQRCSACALDNYADVIICDTTPTAVFARRPFSIRTLVCVQLNLLGDSCQAMAAVNTHEHNSIYCSFVCIQAIRHTLSRTHRIKKKTRRKLKRKMKHDLFFCSLIHNNNFEDDIKLITQYRAIDFLEKRQNNINE